MRCPVCRAENEADSACRRCKADLSLLVALEAQRRRALNDALAAARLGDGRRTERHARHARQLRDDSEAVALLAVAALLQRDFPRAFAYHRLATLHPASR